MISLAMFWTAIVGASLFRNLNEERGVATEMARAQARSAIDKDVLYRRWNANHGGVYVPVTPSMRPNPHLLTGRRDIDTPSGMVLTLVNPAYMTRQVHERGSEISGVQGHITSLKPIRPENAADGWEAVALAAFERGEAECSSIEMFRGEPHLRLMRPLRTEEGCLKCHASQGCQLGDIRGGISVSIPMAPLRTIANQAVIPIATWHGVFWVVGIVGISLFYWRLDRETRTLALARCAAMDSEIKLRESESKFRGIYESSGDAIMLLDENGFFDCNRATLDIFGFESVAEFCSQHPADVSPANQPCGTDSVTLANRRIATAVEQGSDRFDWLHQRADGTPFPAEVLLNALEIDGKRILQAVVRDISERKRAEAAFENALVAAQTANRAKSEFLANMSHEIRTPLTAILGFSDVLLGESIDEDSRSATGTIKRNGQYLLDLINDILDLSKIEANKYEVENIRFSPTKLVAEVLALMQVRAEAKGLPLNAVSVGPVPETIQSDPLRLRQILINLVGNAIKFTETGSVQLVIRVVPDATKPRLQFDVTDTGIGLRQEHADRLFQPFTQVDSSTARRYGGTGLGLTISKRLAQLLGGDISIRSQLGLGSTFCVTVATGSLDHVRMLAGLHDSVSPTRQDVPGTVGQEIQLNGRLLLAEDGPDNQRLISFVLKKAGADVVVAENGKVAVELALAAREAGKPFDLILMDMQMPVMDGYAATGTLRDAGYTGPIVALTAHAMSGDELKCRQAGCDGYATKPIDRRRLFATIAKCLEPARMLSTET